MALTDYRLCDVCGRKTFYDASLIYTDTIKGHNCYPDMVPERVGDWKVICDSCAQTHKVVVVPTQQDKGTE
jgi:hypothetical protein